MQKVTIQRSQWLRQTDENNNRYENPDPVLWDEETQTGCCLGHICHQAHGVDLSNMYEETMPYRIIAELDADAKEILINTEGMDPYEDSDLDQSASKYNDDWDSTDEQKEESIIDLFTGVYEIEFVD